MAKKSNKTNQNKAFIQSPAGYGLTGVLLLAMAYYLFILATDTGSLLVYLAMIIAFGWGVHRVIDGIKLFVKK